MGVEFEAEDLTGSASIAAHFRAYEEPLQVVSSPFPTLNNACRGFGGRKGLAMGWYVVLGGDTGQGKSLLALQMGVEAHKQGHRVGFVSLEMSMHELRSRFYAQAIGIEARRLEPGEYFQESTVGEVMAWSDAHREKHGHHPFFAVDHIGPEIQHVVAQMHAWMADYGVNVFVIDYLQLLEHHDGVGSAREVQKISKAMRDFAHYNGCIVMALSQYNNEGGNDRTRPPHVGHLYGGRRISQDSDITLLLDHSRYEHCKLERHIARTYIMVPKNRHGPNGFELPVAWDYRFLTAREAQPDEEHRWPTAQK